MKEHQLAHIHKRYYIFQHVNGENVLCRTNTGEWADNFYEAMLWEDEEFTINAAKTIKQVHETRGLSVDGQFFVVGRVQVEVDPLYPMVAV